MAEKAPAQTITHANTVDAIAAQEAVEDERVKSDQQHSGGVLNVRLLWVPHCTRLRPVAIYQCALSHQLLLLAAVLLGGCCCHLPILT